MDTKIEMTAAEKEQKLREWRLLGRERWQEGMPFPKAPMRLTPEDVLAQPRCAEEEPAVFYRNGRRMPQPARQ